MLRAEKNYSLAIEYYTAAINLNSVDNEACTNRGNVYFDQNKMDPACQDYKKAISIKPGYKPSYQNRGFVYIELNRHEEAIKDFKTFLIYESDAAVIYNTIGLCYRVQNKFQESPVPVNKAIQMDPHPTFFINRSYVYYGLKNSESAKKDALTAKQGGVQIETNYTKILGLQ